MFCRYLLFIICLKLSLCVSASDPILSGVKVLELIDDENMSPLKKSVAVQFLVKENIPVEPETMEKFSNFLLEPELGYRFRYNDDVYRAIYSLLSSRGKFTKEFQNRLLASIKKNYESYEYVINVFDLLYVPTVSIDKQGKVVVDMSDNSACKTFSLKRDAGGSFDEEKLLKNAPKNIRNDMFFMQLCRETDYQLYAEAVKHLKARLTFVFNYFSRKEALQCISKLIDDFSESQNIELLNFIDKYMSFIGNNDIIKIINVSRKANNNQLAVKVNSFLNKYFFRNEKIGFNWNDWWAQNKNKFDRYQASVASLIDTTLPYEVKKSAILYLRCSQKELTDEAIKNLIELYNTTALTDLKLSVVSLLNDYTEKHLGNKLVQSFLDAVNKNK